MTMRLLAVTPENRTGATLTEVLMSMMILSIGVLSLAAMFPIGILSSVRATQLTHAVTLKQNVASRIDLDPGLILDPDRDHNQHNNAGSNYIIDPLGWIKLADANGDQNGQLDSGESAPPFGLVDANNNGQFDNGESFIGFRHHSGYTTNLQAEALASLPDSWTELASGPQAGFPDRNRVNIDPNTDLTAVNELALLTTTASGAQVPLRVMLVDPRDGQSHTSRINQVAGQMIKWNRQMPMTPVKAMEQVNEIRVQQQELKYSCLLTVRRENSGAASVDVVVFLRRNFTLEDETPIQTLDPEDTNNNGQLDNDEDQNNNGMLDGAFIRGNQSVLVNVPTAVTYKSGGYILDTVNLRWYRIASATRLAGSTVQFDLQTEIVESAPAHPLGAILMPHVVQVFHLGDL